MPQFGLDVANWLWRRDYTNELLDDWSLVYTLFPWTSTAFMGCRGILFCSLWSTDGALVSDSACSVYLEMSITNGFSLTSSRRWTDELVLWTNFLTLPKGALVLVVDESKSCFASWSKNDTQHSQGVNWVTFKRYNPLINYLMQYDDISSSWNFLNYFFLMAPNWLLVVKNFSQQTVLEVSSKDGFLIIYMMSSLVPTVRTANLQFYQKISLPCWISSTRLNVPHFHLSS